MIKDTISDVYPHVLFLAFLVFFLLRCKHRYQRRQGHCTVAISISETIWFDFCFGGRPVGENGNKAIRKN